MRLAQRRCVTLRPATARHGTPPTARKAAPLLHRAANTAVAALQALGKLLHDGAETPDPAQCAPHANHDA